MAARTAWVLNLDADAELAAPRGYTPRAVVLASMLPYVTQLASALLTAGDLLVTDASPRVREAASWALSRLE